MDFIEFALNYHSSSSNFNHAESPDLSYVSVIDHNQINLTPLGKFVMPPPMSEKQVHLTTLDEPVTCLVMYGNSTVALSANGTLIVFDAASFDMKG